MEKLEYPEKTNLYDPVTINPLHYQHQTMRHLFYAYRYTRTMDVQYMYFYTLYIRCRLQYRKRSQESYPRHQQQQQHQSHQVPLQQPLQAHQDRQPIFATGINQGHLNQVPNYAYNKELPPPYPQVGNQAPLSPYGPVQRLYQDLNPIQRKQQKTYKYEGTDANSPEDVYSELYENDSDFCRKSQVSSYR